jgi:hypothetical protein
MKSKDLLYLAVIGGLGYLLYKNSQKPTTDAGATTDGGSGGGTPLPTPMPMITELIGTCPTSFSIPDGTIGNSTLYTSVDGKYYRQAMGSTIRSVRAEITLLEFQNACASFKALPVLAPIKLAPIRELSIESLNKLEDKMVQFNGTLIRGVM